MKIVALDIASVTGVAVGSSGGDPIAWSVDLGKSQSQDWRFSNMLRLTEELLEQHKPDLLACEAPIGGKDANAYLIGLVACVRGQARRARVKCEIYQVGAIRKHFLGRAVTTADFPQMDKKAAKSEIKRLVVTRCRGLKWRVDDHDAADAAALWDYAMVQNSPNYQAHAGGLFAAR